MAVQKRQLDVHLKSDNQTEMDQPLIETVRTQPKATHNKLISRTAVLIRTWWDYEYDDEDLMYLRSMISELSLGSGGEYQVHFLSTSRTTINKSGQMRRSTKKY